MPARIGPAAMAAHKNLCDSARAHRALALGFGFDPVLAPEDGNVTETLHLGAPKFQADQLSPGGMEIDRGLKEPVPGFSSSLPPR